MDKTQVTFKLWRETLNLLSNIRKVTGESRAAIAHRAIQREAERIERHIQKQAEKGGKTE